LVLAVLVCGVFLQVSEFAFLTWDDDHYVTKNPRVQAGLTAKGVAWAFTSFYASNWHPLTWLSHMLDVQLYGLDPAGHHRTSLLLHLATVLLLFLVLRRYTGATWRSFVVAGLFGVHPLRAESVAWVAERKDVLSAMLWVSAMGAYLWYARLPRVGRLLPLCALFTAGLAAKPMLVTLPFVLLLLDWWPLGRHPGRGAGVPRDALPLIAEKIPLFLLSAGSAAITLLAQRQGGALLTLETHPVQIRAANALVSYGTYLGHLLWPGRLAFYYPFPAHGLLSWQVVGAVGVLTLLTLLALLSVRRFPFLATGWSWYLGTLVPVIGLSQVGMQASADRYTYLPSVGIGIALVWAVGELGGGPRRLRFLKASAAAAAMLVLASAAWRQVGTWKDTETMARRALSVTDRNWMAHFLMGNALAARGLRQEAAAHLEESVRFNPNHADAWSNLGGVYAAQGRFQEAERALRQAVRINPGLAAARFNLGFRLLRRGDLAGANEQYEALRILDPAVAENLRRFLAAYR
jgi:tetratricopeptide (TPR) repeat protein